MRFVFFKNNAAGILETGVPRPLPYGYSYRIWRPTVTNIFPRDVLKVHGSHLSVLAWWVLQYLLTRRRIYRIVLIYHNGELVHFTLLSPKNLRCPFMKRDDAKLGKTWTDKPHRGKGLATFAVKQLVLPFKDTDMDFWWYCEEGNQASIGLAKKLGLRYVGSGCCKSRLGIEKLRFFCITHVENEMIESRTQNE